MTMTSELKKSKRGSLDRFFAPPLGSATSSQQSTSSSLAPPKAADPPVDDGPTKGKSSKKMKLVPVINNKPQAFVMVEEDNATANRLSAPKSKSAKRTVTAPPPPPPPVVSKKVHLPLPTKKEHDDELFSSKGAKASFEQKYFVQKMKEVKEEIPQVPQKPRGVRTFRIWHPNTKGKTLRVRVGPTGTAEVSEEIFDFKNIQSKSYEEWKREAKMHLPSATGGPAVENLGDVINIVPSVQKEVDPKKVANTLRRLSLESDKLDDGTGRRKAPIRSSILKQARGPLPSLGEGPESDSSEEDEEEDESSDDDESDYTVIEIDSDEDEEEEEEERKMAGTDIKGKLRTLKELTENLSHKRAIRQQLVQRATGNTLLDAESIPLREHILYLVEYIGNQVHDIFETCTFWSKSLAEINGRYGVVVACYFIWLRRMVVMNAIAFLITLSIIIIPQMVEDQFLGPYNSSGMPEFKLIDLLHGEHSLHHSYLFYSGYTHRNEDSAQPFSNPAVRFLTVMVLVFLVNVYFIFSLINTFYEGIRMESNVAGAANNHHFISIVCGWNFSCGDPKAALYLRKTIQRELHILAYASSAEEGHTIRINKQNKRLLSYFVQKLGLRTGTYLMHLISSTLVLFLCAILGIIVFSLCQFKLEYYLECIPTKDDGTSRKISYSWVCEDGDLSLEAWVMALPALFATVVTLCLDWIITKIGDMEAWKSTERNVYARMFRAGLLYGTNLQVIYWFWETNDEKMMKEGFTPETIFAKELYRLVVLQGILDIIINFAVLKLYDMIRHCLNPEYRRSEFPTEHCTLGMFFLHSLALMGPLFSPGLGLFITIRLILDFYRHRYALFHLHSNDGYTSHASSVYGPYLVTFFVAFLFTSFMNIYYMSETVPSTGEGPFVTYPRYDKALLHLISGKTGFRWLRYLAEPGFLVGFLALLLGLVYFNWQWSRAYEPIIQELNDTIFLERADRETLLKAIFEIGQATRFGAASRQATQATTDASASSAIPTSTDVSDAEEVTRKRKSMASEQPGEGGRKRISAESTVSSNNKQKLELKKLMSQVKVNQSLTGLQKNRKSVTVDTWNSQRHRRDDMEKYVKGIVGARRNARSDVGPTLAYDPTSKIFKKKPNSSGSDSGSSSDSSSTKAKKTKSNIAPPTKIAGKAATTSSHLLLPVVPTKTSSTTSVLSAQSQSRNQHTPTGRRAPPAQSKRRS